MNNNYALAIEKRPVSHCWKGRGGFMPIAIVERSMQGTMEDCWRYFDGQNNGQKYTISAHYGVGQDGQVWQFVEDEDTAWSNGVLQAPDLSIDWLKEVFEEQVNCNLITLSIEYEGSSGEPLTEPQYEAALSLHRQLIGRWEIEADDKHIIGHNRLDTVERSANPGPAFPWQRLLSDLSQPSAAIQHPEVEVQPETEMLPFADEIFATPVAAKIVEDSRVQHELPDFLTSEMSLPEIQPTSPDFVLEEPEKEMHVSAMDDLAPTSSDLNYPFELPSGPELETPEVPVLFEVNETQVSSFFADFEEPTDQYPFELSGEAPTEELSSEESAAAPPAFEAFSMPQAEVRQPDWQASFESANVGSVTEPEQPDFELPDFLQDVPTVRSPLRPEEAFSAPKAPPPDETFTAYNFPGTGSLHYEELDMSMPEEPEVELPSPPLLEALEDVATRPGPSKPVTAPLFEPGTLRSAPDSKPTTANLIERSAAPGTDETKINRANIGSGVIAVDLANIRVRPSFDKDTILIEAEGGTRFEFDGWANGPELRGSYRWYHISEAEGGGWTHSSLVELDQPFNP